MDSNNEETKPAKSGREQSNIGIEIWRKTQEKREEKDTSLIEHKPFAPSDKDAKFEINAEIERAMHALKNSNKHIFITGSAGTGKSTLLRRYIETNDMSHTAVLAPTGVAAINVNGETIHHFFGLKPGCTPDDMEDAVQRAKRRGKMKLFKALDAIIIDEISMVRADMFDCIDMFLRKIRKIDEVLGGVRLIAFGDLYQLPPVVTNQEKSLFEDYYNSPYFFGSRTFYELYQNELRDFEYIELTKVYRQRDSKLIDLLNAVREGKATDDDIELLNQRVVSAREIDELNDESIYLTTTNAKADERNAQKLQEIDTESFMFNAETEGDFPNQFKPTTDVLEIKIGAQVMIIMNDINGKYTNGTLGQIYEISYNKGNPMKSKVKVRLKDTGRLVTITRNTFDAVYNSFDIKNGVIIRKTLGSFTQFPLRLAWAVTIHKAQGKTFSSLIIDLERRAFAEGQTYVALSRATTFDGLYLTRPIRKSDIIVDQNMVKTLDVINMMLHA
ncbi:MAG: AAA family ATPase [Bifidobacteriaceae bacterium]|jgi:ATP-dependent exoDNAse (exonuclease V) alpha subunit|nr:AAA family ATPase [Bifidobacteriaceae bacterium]